MFRSIKSVNFGVQDKWCNVSQHNVAIIKFMQVSQKGLPCIFLSKINIKPDEI
jgi:hypothetical protein